MTIECFPIHTSYRCCGTSNGTGRRELSGEEKKKRITRCAFQLSDVLRNSPHSRSKHDIHNLVAPPTSFWARLSPIDSVRSSTRSQRYRRTVQEREISFAESIGWY